MHHPQHDILLQVHQFVSAEFSTELPIYLIHQKYLALWACTHKHPHCHPLHPRLMLSSIICAVNKLLCCSFSSMETHSSTKYFFACAFLDYKGHLHLACSHYHKQTELWWCRESVCGVLNVLLLLWERFWSCDDDSLWGHEVSMETWQSSSFCLNSWWFGRKLGFPATLLRLSDIAQLLSVVHKYAHAQLSVLRL